MNPKSFANKNKDTPDQAHLVQRRLMLPLSVTFFILTILVAIVLWHLQNDHFQEELNQSIYGTQHQFQQSIEEQTTVINVMIDNLLEDHEILGALKSANYQTLLSLGSIHYKNFNKKYHITHFYFHNKIRYNIVRIHAPDKSGGLISRHTILEAERTGKTYAGIETGPLGTLTLRVVSPVFIDNNLIGYIEIGREIDDLIKSIHTPDHSIELAVSIHKSMLLEEELEARKSTHKYFLDWDAFNNDVVIASTIKSISPELLATHLKNYRPEEHARTDNPSIKIGDRIWRTTFIPILDSSGIDIGDICILLDVTNATHEFITKLLITGALVAIILGILLVFIYSLLRKTDTILIKQNYKIRKIEKQHKAVIDVAINGIVLINDKGIILLANPAMEKIFGYKDSELLGENVSILMPDPYHSNHDQYLENYHRTGQAKIIGIGREALGKRKNGSIFPIELSVTEAHVDNEKEYVGLIRDITQQKDAEDELIHAKEEAEHASNAKTIFLSSMSHELRTPLNSILGFGQLLQQNESLDDNAKDCLQEIMIGGQHLLNLVNDVLDLAKIESEQLTLSIHATELAPLVDICYGLLTPMAASKNVQLDHSIPNNTFVLADDERLKQILINLVSNAIKYNKPGGNVSIKTDNLKNNFLRISVIDTGHGIPQDRFDALFTPFNRLGEECGTVEGSGIGLTITLRLAELMEGLMGVESKVGVGSRFWIELPIPELQQK